jgi:excisionase family DNA binding protein
MVIDETKTLLSPAEFARRLGVSVVTVRMWIAKRKISATRVGDRMWRIRESELTRMLEDGASPRREEQSRSAVSA